MISTGLYAQGGGPSPPAAWATTPRSEHLKRGRHGMFAPVLTTSRLIGIPFYLIIWNSSIVDAWNAVEKIIRYTYPHNQKRIYIVTFGNSIIIMPSESLDEYRKVNTIIERDSTDATYKFTLLRGAIEVRAGNIHISGKKLRIRSGIPSDSS